MIRHGQSSWNLEGRYSGWCDIPLTAEGEADAYDAGIAILERGYKFDVAFTSKLERAWRTCAIALGACNQTSIETVRSSRLNERHYGALQGHLKDSRKIRSVFGQSTVEYWRRSYLGVPPSMYDIDFLKKIGSEGLLRSTSAMDHNYIDWDRFDIIRNALDYDPTAEEQVKIIARQEVQENGRSYAAPTTESLKMCELRAYKYWEDNIVPRIKNGEQVLIVAHANTLRALIKAIDNISPDQIPQLRIPNGIPLVYNFDENMQPSGGGDAIGFQARYLVTARNYPKIQQYAYGQQAKLKGIFNFLDADGDGYLTANEMLSQISRLRNMHGDRPDEQVGTVGMKAHRNVVADRKQWGRSSALQTNKSGEGRVPINFGEYEVQELFKCIPESATSGRINLQEFLDAADILLPKLKTFHLYSKR